MKELSIEEKAKRYDEALNRAKKVHKYSSDLAEIKLMEGIFPELKESDEKIRKEIIAFIKKRDRSGCDYDYDQWIAWLEKQGDDKVEQKFKIGDWVVFNNKHQSIYQIEKIEDWYYILRHTHGGTFRVCVLHDESLRPWTIQDAKNGDVLSNGTTIFIFKDLLSDGSVMSYCDYNANSGESDAFCPLSMNLMCSKITPATQEQRDLLFQKMKEAGYEWDTEKKELRKIEEDLTEFENALADVCRGWIGEELGWKDYIIKNSLPLLELAKEQFDKYEQKLASWSEEDEAKLKSILFHIEDVENKDVIDWFKSLKDRVQQKQEWSEEDIKMFVNIKACLRNANKDYSTELDWLKSLKERYAWKPSEEQMKALEHFVRSIGESGYASPYDNDTKLIYSLYEQLKQL